MVDLVVAGRYATGLFSAGTEPAQVTGLVASFITATFVDLAWNAATNAVTYNVYRNDQLVGITSGTSFRVTGLTSNTAYQFQVAGVDALFFTGLRSSILNVTTAATPEWIGIPFPLFDLGVGSTYDLKGFISPAPTAGYTFTSIGTALPSGVTLNGATGVLTYDGIAGISDASTFAFRYTDGINPSTDRSNIRIQVKDDVIPTVPTSPQSASITPATFTLSWTASVDAGGISGYNIWRNGVLFVFSSGTGVSYAVTGQAEGSTNIWRISAIDNSSNESPQSVPLSVQQTTSTLVFAANVTSYLPIVPGGAGFGMDTPAGSGRHSIAGGLAAAITVWFITNLNLSGTGSLKAFLQGTGPRIGIPTISGVINYSGQAENTGAGTGRNINIVDGRMIYAGQCAPSPGLLLRGAHIILNTDTARDCLLWHLPIFQDVYANPTYAESNGDCFGIGGTANTINANIVLANCYFTFSTDELCDNFYGVNNITYYQSIFAEPIHASTHPKGPHGFGPLLTNNRSFCQAALLRNILAHCFTRSPASAAFRLTMANNVIYNPGDRGTQLEGRSAEGATNVNLEHNVYIKGPSTTSVAATPIHRPTSGGNQYLAGSNHWLDGNRAIGWDDSTQAALLGGSGGTFAGSRILPSFPTGYTVTSATNREELTRLVMRFAGPRPSNRLSHIQRVVNHIEARMTGIGSQGAIINSPADVGGFPTLANNSVDHTTGGDPIPGITTQSSTPTTLGTTGRTIQVSGYTALEEWLHRRHNEVMPSG